MHQLSVVALVQCSCAIDFFYLAASLYSNIIPTCIRLKIQLQCWCTQRGRGDDDQSGHSHSLIGEPGN